MNRVSTFLQCGAFILIPIATFVFGIWKIMRFDKKYHRISIAGLIGFVFFEGSIIGMLIDPRSGNVEFQGLFLTAIAIGITSFLFVLLLLPIGIAILRLFR